MKKSQKKPQLTLTYFSSVGIVFIAAAVGSAFTTPSLVPWYAELTKPFFNPPNWVFAPVWTILYLLMGIAVGRIWLTKPSALRTNALLLFTLQLTLNMLWSIVFFGLQNPLAALLVIFALLVALYATIKRFSKIVRPAGYILYPYFAWVSFATLLNLSIVALN